MTDQQDTISVPIRELKKLEEARKKIYEHLGACVAPSILQKLTEQIWLDGTETMSCNKYAVCLSYDSLLEENKRLHAELLEIHTIAQCVAECSEVQEGDSLTVKAVKGMVHRI